MAGKAPISLHTARIPWVAILRIRGSRPEVKLRRNTSASSEGIHSTLPKSGYRAPAIARASGSLGVRDRGAPITPHHRARPGAGQPATGSRACPDVRFHNRREQRPSLVSGARRCALHIAKRRPGNRRTPDIGPARKSSPRVRSAGRTWRYRGAGIAAATAALPFAVQSKPACRSAPARHRSPLNHLAPRGDTVSPAGPRPRRAARCGPGAARSP